MEPTVLSVASPIIQKAAELAKNKLEAGNQLAASDAKRYVSYLEGALEAIRGLENEYVDILVEAMHCQVDISEQRDHLAIRIQQHLYREILRPHLVYALERLEEGRPALEKHADRVFLWPNVRRGRADALAAYESLLERLRSYIGQLGNWYGNATNQYVMDAVTKGQPLPMGGSGFNVEGLHEILGCLARRDQEGLGATVGAKLRTLPTDRHLTITRDVARVVESMLITFR